MDESIIHWAELIGKYRYQHSVLNMFVAKIEKLLETVKRI
jgi:hypothetical protein